VVTVVVMEKIGW
jgi:hypothetical protein